MLALILELRPTLNLKYSPEGHWGHERYRISGTTDLFSHFCAGERMVVFFIQVININIQWLPAASHAADHGVSFHRFI